MPGTVLGTRDKTLTKGETDLRWDETYKQLYTVCQMMIDAKNKVG